MCVAKKGTHGFQTLVSSTGDTISIFSVLNRTSVLDRKPLKERKGLFEKLDICGTKTLSKKNVIPFRVKDSLKQHFFFPERSKNGFKQANIVLFSISS